MLKDLQVAEAAARGIPSAPETVADFRLRDPRGFGRELAIGFAHGAGWTIGALAVVTAAGAVLSWVFA